MKDRDLIQELRDRHTKATPMTYIEDSALIWNRMPIVLDSIEAALRSREQLASYLEQITDELIATRDRVRALEKAYGVKHWPNCSFNHGADPICDMGAQCGISLPDPDRVLRQDPGRDQRPAEEQDLARLGDLGVAGGERPHQKPEHGDQKGEDGDEHG